MTVDSTPAFRLMNLAIIPCSSKERRINRIAPLLKHSDSKTQGGIEMRFSEKDIQGMKAIYERRGQKITNEEAREAAENLLNYFRLLERLRPKPRQDLNPEVVESQLVDE